MLPKLVEEKVMKEKEPEVYKVPIPEETANPEVDEKAML